MASQIPITVRAQPAAASSAALRGKKRPGSPAVSAAPQAPGCGSKKKKAPLIVTPTAPTQTVPTEGQDSADHPLLAPDTPESNAGIQRLHITVVETVAEVKAAASVDSGPPPATEPTVKPPPFKDPSFTHSGIGGAAAGKKNRTWKNLKQILALERTLPWKLDDPSYYNIDAPPSLKPAKKYSDISGLPANYADPQTKLRFTSCEEFSYIRLLPTDVVTGYLALRKASCIVP